MKPDLIFPSLWRTALLALALCAAAVLGGLLSGMSAELPPDPETAGQTLLALLVVQSVHALLLAGLIWHCRVRSWRLAGLVSLLIFGISTWMPQMETLLFGDALGIGTQMLGRILVSGLIGAAAAGPAAAGLFGNLYRAQQGGSQLRTSGLVWRVPLLAGLYVSLYLLFGYFIAWQSPEVRAFYQGNTQLLPFPEHLAAIVRDDPGFLLFQWVRGGLWTGFVMLILYSCAGLRWVLAVLCGLLLGLLMNMQLFLPNPFMPEPVRMIHFAETATSTALFGIVAAWTLMVPRRPSATA